MKLEALPKPKMEIASMPQNKGKCRYKLLYPADDHRVVLTREGEGNDFINASYIANKCEQYWPLDKHPKTFGDVTVCSKSVECWADFTQTRLSISKDDETRTLSHFNYLSWPDHGVPDDLSSYVAFYFKIKSLVSHSTNPLLIHCSAGVGRTGTYIALEYLIQQAKREDAVDVFGCVEAMRKRRPCMVQKDDQYIFLHEVLAESLAVEGFKCSPLEINYKIEAHEQRETQDQPNSILQEFQHMESRLQTMQFKYTIAQEEDNLKKNRLPEILPCDQYMPFVINGEGSYINAVFVNSYTCNHQFIATQLPLSNTLSNFWQLIFEQDVKVVVQLEHAEIPFFPMTDLATLSTSFHSLVRGTAEEKEHVRIIPLKIQTSQVEKSIFIIQMKAWCDTAEQYPTGEALLSLCGAADDILKKTDGSKKTCVTCL
ncbi:hypothetical protein EB796_003402 [Bugula neritina]|uniref:protein-tyrosine-phosphatase n=1 Tax=Bugula neritina TaxID=10212 RepID=A0A7J7KJZ5_BUGNE|nr:hypothetical protein EB796_003402 [Bugula neritina]